MTKVHPCCSSNNFSTQNVCPQRVRSIIAHARERVKEKIINFKVHSLDARDACDSRNPRLSFTRIARYGRFARN